jgi:hypothetical protein
LATSRRGISLGNATPEDRMAIKRAVYKVVDSIIEGVLFRMHTTEFEAATLNQVAERRFDRGQVVLEQALIEAFPRYADMAASDVDSKVGFKSTDRVRDREGDDTGSDPYRTIHYEVDTLEPGPTADATVERVVLAEALAVYNEIVELFRRGLADEEHELEALRLEVRARYKDLVEVDMSDLVRARHSAEERRGPVGVFLDWLVGR